MKNPASFLAKNIRKMSGYIPGYFPIKTSTKTSSLGGSTSKIIKLNTNENPFPPPSCVLKELKNALSEKKLQLYPEPKSLLLRDALAEKWRVPASSLLVGNGSDEILNLVFRAIFLREEGETPSCLLIQPGYSLYDTLAESYSSPIVYSLLQKDWSLDFSDILRKQKVTKNPVKLTAIANPNSPTGIATKREELLKLVDSNTNSLTLIDEAYIEFCDESVASFAGTDQYPRLMVSGTLSKSSSLAGLRIGYLIAHPSIIMELDKIRDSYNLNTLSQVAALASLKKESRRDINKNIEIIKKNRDYLTQELSKLGFETLPSSANFIYTRVPENKRKKDVLIASAAEIYYKYLIDKKIFVRYFSTGPCVDFVRISIGKKEEMQLLIKETKSFLEGSY